MQEGMSAFPQPKCKLFEIHRSKFELDPVGNTGKSTVRGITHGVFFFCVSKDPFNGLASPSVGCFAQGREPHILCSLDVIFPDMPCHRFLYIAGRQCISPCPDMLHRYMACFCIHGIPLGLSSHS